MSGPLLFAVSVTVSVLTLYVIQHFISAYLARTPPQDQDAQFLARRNDAR
jgi:hypothetical protein